MENEWASDIRLFRACMLRSMLSKRYIIHLVITLFMSVLSVQLLSAINQTMRIMSPEIFEAFKSGDVYNIGVLTVSSLDLQKAVHNDQLITSVLSGSFLLCIIASYISTYICNELKNGYMGVAMTHGQSRSSLYNQYLLVSVLASLPFAVLSIIGVLISLKIHSLLIITDIYGIMRTLLFQIILIFLCSSCFSCLSMMINGYKAVALCVSCVFVLPLLPGYMYVFSGGYIDIEKYSMLSTLIHSSRLNAAEIAFGLIVSLCTTLILHIIGLILFKRKNFE